MSERWEEILESAREEGSKVWGDWYENASQILAKRVAEMEVLLKESKRLHTGYCVDSIPDKCLCSAGEWNARVDAELLRDIVPDKLIFKGERRPGYPKTAREAFESKETNDER